MKPNNRTVKKAIRRMRQDIEAAALSGAKKPKRPRTCGPFLKP